MKLKINWGTAIVIAMVLFMVFILQFVYRSVTVDKYSHELVSDDYYKDELYYQREIDKMNNASQLEENVHIKRVKEGFQITFPANMNSDRISGMIYFQRPSNKNLDFKEKIIVTESKQLVTHTNIVTGKWKVKVDWNYNDKEYLFKETTYY